MVVVWRFYTHFLNHIKLMKEMMRMLPVDAAEKVHNKSLKKEMCMLFQPEIKKQA